MSYRCKSGRVAYGIDPVDRCNPPIAYYEHSITMDCGHGRNCGGVAIVSAALLKTSEQKCYNGMHREDTIETNDREKSHV